MLSDQTIAQRLEEMSQQNDPFESFWPENCAGSRKALVIFVGPSPGGTKEKQRREIKLCQIKPLWNEPYTEPLDWSNGFKISFQPIVEQIIKRSYKPDGAKLIARVNMDWLGNPESQDVSYRYMWEGCLHILPVLYQCNPDLIIPMDEKTFGVLQIALYQDGYNILPANIGAIKVRISDKNGKERYHKNIQAFKAKKEENSFLVIKSLQHPARIYNFDYAKRVGQATRLAAEQIWNDRIVNIDI